jgi:FSR family fosmidomycin resistance protein-like MFS transporter
MIETEEPVTVGAQMPAPKANQAVFKILGALSGCHLVNDLIQSLVPALYPLLKASYHLTFAEVGLITLTQQITASLLQPLVGFFTDRRPMPYSLVVGMMFTVVGLTVMAHASYFWLLIVGAAIIGMGSSIFHPESSKIARMASGGHHGLAQSLFQVGGNAGASFGPLMAATIVVPHGQGSLQWFSVFAFVAMLTLTQVGRWYKNRLAERAKLGAKKSAKRNDLSKARIAITVALLLLLIFSKNFYLASITSYFTFFMIHKFHVSVQNAQYHLFAFLAAVALGTYFGGPIGDKIGRKYVIWGSIVGALPFALMLPTAGLVATGVLSIVIGFVIASAFSAILVYAQELLPASIGLVSGLFLGFAFGIGGIGAALLGKWADIAGIEFVYRVCSFLPAIGLLAMFLPNIEQSKIDGAVMKKE